MRNHTADASEILFRPTTWDGCIKPVGKQWDTLPETTMAPENTPWKRRFLLESIIFCVRTVSFREGKLPLPQLVSLPDF